MRCAGAGAIAFALSAGLAGCCAPERVILLPAADGRNTAVIARAAGQPDSPGLLVARPYAQASLEGHRLSLNQADAEQVRREFGALIAFAPPRPRVFTVNFSSNSNHLTPETEPVLAQVRQLVSQYPAGEVIVIGHTDSVGSVETNDVLSLARAEVVASLLIEMGVPAAQVQRQGRGQRDPLVPTADGVDEPRNRRVEIKVR